MKIGILLYPMVLNKYTIGEAIQHYCLKYALDDIIFVAFKGTDAHMRCRIFPYHFGRNEDNIKDRPLELCSRGLHSCWELDAVFDYYPLRYLQLNANVGIETFGSGRWLNQRLYHSSLWADVKNEIILRDNGCDLGLDGYEIRGHIYIHHLNPITKEDVLNNSSNLYDPNNLICVSFDTHQSIHYGSECAALSQLVERRPNDTCPWKR